MSLLAAAVLVAALQPVALQAGAAPEHCATVVGAANLARTCPVLEVTGTIGTASVMLDPMFDEFVSPADVQASVRTDGPPLQVDGFAADGRRLFSTTVRIANPFRALIPLAPATIASLARVRATYAGFWTDRTASAHGAPEAEVVDLDGRAFFFAWDATMFPAVRVFDDSGRLLAKGTGALTLEQLTIAGAGKDVAVVFSDGIHSASRRFRIFGR